MKKYFVRLAALASLSALLGCHSPAQTIVGVWKHTRPNGAINTVEYKTDGTWTHIGAIAGVTPYGAWKTDGNIVHLTGIPTTEFKWKLSEDGKTMTPNPTNKPEQIWERQ